MGKLVRDRIPEIIEAAGRQPRTRVLHGDEYVEALHLKLLEEARELAEAEPDDRLEEAADVFEVLREIAGTLGEDMEGVAAAADRKRDERGGFANRVWLES